MLHGGDIYSNKIEYDFSVNLNPIGCPASVIEDLKKSIDCISYYPDLNQTRAREAISNLEGVKHNNVMAGNGASELIMAVVRMINPQRVIVLQPSFYGYIHAVKSLNNCEVIPYLLCEDNDFSVTSDFVGFLREIKPDMVFVANPNNPTGRLIEESLMEDIICVCNEINADILVDECFLRMTEQAKSAVSLVNSYSNLFVLNAFTKLFSLPGVRIGYILSNERNIESLKRFLPEWNISVLAETASVECSNVLITDKSFLVSTLNTIDEERKFLINNLEGLVDKVYVSDTSYILTYSKKPLYELLLKEKILIRDCSNFEGLGEGYFRIAIKDHASNVVLINTLRKVTANGD